MKFLLSAYTGLGNFILKTPLIRAIHQQFSGAQVDLLCGAPFGTERVLQGSRWISRTHWCPHDCSFVEKLRMLKALRRERYDVVLLPFDSTPGYLRNGIHLIGAKRIVSHVHLTKAQAKQKLIIGLRLLQSFEHCWVPVLIGRHECDLNLDLLEPLLAKPCKRDLQTFVHWGPEDISSFKLPKKYCVIQPGASNGSPTPKTWDPRNFGKVILQVKKDFPTLQFAMVGDRGDAVALEEAGLLTENVINLLGKTTFNQLCNVLNGAELVLSHDSGIMHIANAMQKPLIALYGPTDFTRTMPLSSSSHMLFSRNECWAKMYAFREGEADLMDRFPSYYCMSDITVGQVVSFVRGILKDDLKLSL